MPISDILKKWAVSRLAKQLPYASKDNLVKLAGMVEKMAILPEDKERARVVGEKFKAEHPSLIYAKEILGRLNPKCRDKFSVNLVVNHLAIGNGIRKKFAEKNGFLPPSTILISPSMKCNLRCQGCYAADYEKETDMEPSVLDKIVKEGKEMGTFFYTILGGEPFIYPHLLDFIARHPDCYFQIFTNGTLLDSEKINRLVKIGNAALMFSLEGFEKETNERRAPGVYGKVMDAMEHAREAGLLFGYSCYVTKNNVEQIVSDEFIDLMIQKGALIGWYFLCMPVGKKPSVEFMPTPQQRLYLKMRRDHIRNAKPIFIVDFWNDAPYVRGCIAGRQFIHVNSRGDIEPCIFIHFATHNIKNSSISEALKSPFFRALKNRQPYDDNLYLPCTIIDNPEVLRETVERTNPYPTHQGASTLINDPEIRGHLDSYAREVRSLYNKVWEEDIKRGDWKLARKHTAEKRMGIRKE